MNPAVLVTDRVRVPAQPSAAEPEPRVDVDAAGARSRERHRRALITAASAIGPKLLTLALLLVGSRAVASALPPDGFGVWLLLVTASGLLGFADFGLGNGLLNEVAAATGRDDPGAVHRAISSASAALAVVAAGLLGAFLVTAWVVPWSSILDVRGVSAESVSAAVGVFVAGTALNIAFGAAPRVRLALQTGWISNFWNSAGGVVSLVAVLFAADRGASLPVLVAAALIGPPLVAAADTIFLFGVQRPDLRPRRQAVHRVEATRLARQGAMFCFLAVAIAVAFESDVLVISHVLGAAAVPQFALPYRVLMFAPSAVSLVAVALWPAYAESMARGDRAWAERTLKRSLLIAAGGTAAVSALVVGVGPTVLGWITGQTAPSRGLLLVLGLLACVMSVSTALGVFLSATGQLRIQVATAAVMAPANLALSIVLVSHLGVVGPAWGTIVTQTFLVLVPVGFVVNRVLRSHRSDPIRTSLRPSRLSTALMRTLVRATARAPKGVLRRGLSALRKARLLAGDPAVLAPVGGRELLLPLSHNLPVFQARHCDYSLNLGRVAAALNATQAGAPIIIDIGANVGDSVAIIRQQVPDAPILCIEGDDLFLPFLRHNVRDLAGVEVAAVYVRYARDERDHGSEVVRSGGTAQLVDRPGSPAVTTTPLASILDEHPGFRRPEMIKLDTDGHDADILLQSEGVLAACRPLVFFEFDPLMAAGARGTDPHAALELLARLGYCRALFFTNTGELAGAVDAGAWLSEARALTADAGPGRPVSYFDVCVFGPDHRALADCIERSERARL